MAGPPEPIAVTVSKLLDSRGSRASERAAITFNDLTVEGAGRGVQGTPTVWTSIKSWGSVANPRTYTGTQPSRTLLHGFSGTLGKGEMLMVIGKPGSGCTTFLKTLADMRAEYKDTAGQLTYGGRVASEKDQDPVRPTFCAEEDSHLPTLTVAQTLRFAVRSTWESKSSKEAINAAVESLAKCFGLSHVLNTRVGSDKVQGVSGGERRRVSLAEAMATCPDLLCYDNPTNGLDSSTALEFVEMAREFTKQSGCSTAMSVYQGSNAMIPYFDKVLVINGGRQIYYGPASEAQPYFTSLGFIHSDRVTTTDFLNSMTAEPKLRHAREGFEHSVPRTAIEFERAFRQSKYYHALQSSVAAEKAKDTSIGPKRPVFALPVYKQVSLCAQRQFRVLITDYRTWGVDAACIIVQSILLGTIFRDQKRVTQSFYILATALWYAALMPALQSMSEFGNTFDQRDLVIRQKRYRFYRPMSYGLGLLVTDLVWKIAAISYNIPAYFMTGLQQTAAKFFTYFVTVYVEHIALSMIFRVVAVFSPSMGVAALPVGIMFNSFIMYTGFYIPPPQMQKWLFWIRYLDPLHYGFESLIINEFGDLQYECSPLDLAPYGPSYDSISNQVCAVVGSEPGQRFVSGASYILAQYGFELGHLWRNVGINIGFSVFFAILTGIGMEMYKLPAGKLATVFYKVEPTVVTTEKDSLSSDAEKGHSDEDTPPMSLQEDDLKHVATHYGRSLLWKDITLDVKAGKEQKRLLNGVNGFVKPGTLTALMGVSGAGKTTLLNTLAGRTEIGKLSGDIYLDGSALPKSFRRHMGYVPQQDIHLPTQTVREALTTTARLRRPQNVPIEEKDAYVEQVIDILEMQSIADALIGTSGAGLNLEQRKRVTIGIELSAKPDILFLDEPSSGLDGQSALNIVRLLRKLAESGQTILCTIHQPATELIEHFQHLVLLLKGGLVAYDGPMGSKCSTVLKYFAQHTRPCGPQENPAEYFLQAVGAGSRNESKVDWPKMWQSSSEREGRLAEMQDTTTNIEHETSADDQRTFATSFLFQLSEITKRTWLYYWRDPEYFNAKLWLNVGNALLNGLTYLNSPDNQKGAYNRVFSSFVAIIVGPPLGLQVEGRFFNMREIFLLREKGSQTYHWTVFVAAAIIVELPYAFITSLVYWLLWYFPVGYFTESTRAGYSFLMYELFSVFVVSLAQLIAAIMPSLGSAFAANGFFFNFINTFTGTLVPEPLSPAGWTWYFKVSPLFYFTEGFTVNFLQGLRITCDSDETSIFQPVGGQTCNDYANEFLSSATGYLVNGNATSDCQYCRYRDGEAYYQQYGYLFSDRAKDVGIFIGFIAFNFTAVLALTYLTKIHKWRRG